MAYPEHMNAIEARIIDAILTASLAEGHLISVSDGEEYTVRKSRDIDAIRAAIATTDETTLRIRDSHGNDLGVICLVHGNDGDDVVSDYTDNAAMNALVEAGNASDATTEYGAMEDGAPKYKPRAALPGMDHAALQVQFDAFRAVHDLPEQSADELLLDLVGKKSDLGSKARAHMAEWLSAFVEEWDAETDRLAEDEAIAPYIVMGHDEEASADDGVLLHEADSFNEASDWVRGYTTGGDWGGHSAITIKRRDGEKTDGINNHVFLYGEQE